MAKSSKQQVDAKVSLGGTTFGGFLEPSFITIDDEYEKRIEVPSRHLGASMKTNPPKKGKTPDAFFDKEVRRLEDKYNDPGRSEAEKKAKELSKKAMVGDPWKHPNPAKKATGSGSYFGTFSEKAPFAHEQEYETIKKNEHLEAPKPQPANITCPSPKRGGFGMCGQGIYFSVPEPPKEGKGDVYEAQRAKEKEEVALHKKKMLHVSSGGKPFRSAAKTKRTFDEADVTGISKIYANDKPLPPIKEPKKDTKGEKTISTPFRYSSPPKMGEAGCLNSYTKRLEGKADPYDAKLLKEKEDRKKAPKPLGGVWRAVSGPKSGCTKSLLRTFY